MIYLHPVQQQQRALLIFFLKICLFSPVYLCSSVLFLDYGERSITGLSDSVISAGLQPHQLNWPCLPGGHFSTFAVLIRAAGEESRFHSRRLRNVSARKVEVQRDQTHVPL